MGEVNPNIVPAMMSTVRTSNVTDIHSSRVYTLAIVTSMGAFLFGYDLAFIGTSIELAPFQRYERQLQRLDVNSQTQGFRAARSQRIYRGRFLRKYRVPAASRLLLRVTGSSTCRRQARSTNCTSTRCACIRRRLHHADRISRQPGRDVCRKSNRRHCT